MTMSSEEQARLTARAEKAFVTHSQRKVFNKNIHDLEIVAFEHGYSVKVRREGGKEVNGRIVHLPQDPVTGVSLVAITTPGKKCPEKNPLALQDMLAELGVEYTAPSDIIALDIKQFAQPNAALLEKAKAIELQHTKNYKAEQKAKFAGSAYLR